MFDLSALGDWRALPFFNQQLPLIEHALSNDPRDVMPPPNQVFAALERTAPDAVRVIVLGQDPYPTSGHAHGFAFSAAAMTRPLPKSLTNIFSELRQDIGDAPDTADLRFWADQGVLLLNTVLTVPSGTPKGHAKLGWQLLTAQVLARLADRPRAYLLWGRDAHKTASNVDAASNFKLQTSHPSPLGVTKSGKDFEAFRGSRQFSRVNAWLQQQGQSAISWGKPSEVV